MEADLFQLVDDRHTWLDWQNTFSKGTCLENCHVLLMMIYGNTVSNYLRCVTFVAVIASLK